MWSSEPGLNQLEVESHIKTTRLARSRPQFLYSLGRFAEKKNALISKKVVVVV